MESHYFEQESPLAKKIRFSASLPFQTPGEEIANSVLHGLGALLSVAGLIILVLRAQGFLGGRAEGPGGVATFTIYTATLIILFSASTLYHGIQHLGAKRILRILDHSAIYLLIAGTYTPLCLLGLRGAWGWALFGIEWGLAILGIVLYSVGLRGLKKVEVVVYILMGWAVVAGWGPLMRALPPGTVYWLLGGGVAYTAGTLWYRQKTRRGTHVVWHVFVLIGALCHWWTVFLIS